MLEDHMLNLTLLVNRSSLERTYLVMPEIIAKWEKDCTGSACKLHSPNCIIDSGVNGV